MGCHSLLQGVFPTQGLNPGLLYCRWILYQLSHKGSPEEESEYLKNEEILKEHYYDSFRMDIRRVRRQDFI